MEEIVNCKSSEENKKSPCVNKIEQVNYNI